MEEEMIISIYVTCQEVLDFLNVTDDKRAKMTNAEVMTTSIISAYLFHGNYEKARWFLKQYNYIKKMLSKSRLNRRIHNIDPSVWETVFKILAAFGKGQNSSSEYLVDSFPVPCCENIRIFHCKIYNEEVYRGYIASKKQYFFGLKVHMVTTESGIPVEFFLVPGSKSDCRSFHYFDLDFLEDSVIYADKAYNDYEYEDFLLECGVEMIVQRKENSKRPHLPWIRSLCNRKRKMVETTFSQIKAFFPRCIQAVTSNGFELKVILFVLAYSIKRAFCG